MVRHYIILSSSYSQGQRIALDIVGLDESNIDYFYKMIEKIKLECGEDTSLSVHCIETPSALWQSVVDEDSFFEDVLVVSQLDEFIQVIKMDRTLSGLDIAKYILSQRSCTHLKLQKLVYYCFADYLCATGYRLFEDKIYAFDLGPVINSVREEFKGFRYIDADNVDTITEISSLKMPIRSKILFADNGIKKLKSVDKTLKKYGEFSASYLIMLTHQKGTPWADSYDKTLFKEIPDYLIKEKHYLEEVAS